MGLMKTRLMAALPAVVILAALAFSYLPFISDDALISLRYAERLLDGKGLTWSDGEAVEGYSNLLWVLLSAALGALGIDLILAVRILGIAGSVAAVLAVASRSEADRADSLTAGFAAGVAALALAASGPLAVWTVGGLEQPLLAALLAWALATGLRLVEPQAADGAWIVPAVLLAALCWTRPDGPIFTVGCVAGLLFARGFDSPTIGLALRLAGVPLIAWAAQLGFRLAYYDAWVPNSATAKLAFSVTRFADGASYVGRGLLWSAPLVLAVLFLSLRNIGDRETVRRMRFLTPPLLLWLGYVASVGGDSFPARRHLVAALVILALMLATTLSGQVRNGIGRAVWAAAAIGLLAMGVLHFRDPENHRARLERWEWDGQAVALLLRNALPPDTLVAVDPAGTVPYFSGLPALDMLGINDRWLAHNPPDDFGSGDLGHELGNGRYVLEREPDVVLFCGPAGGAQPCFRSGQEMVELEAFRASYRLVTLAAEQPHAFTFQPWVRLEGRAGIQRTEDTVEVPAHLLMATGRTVARADSAGELLVDLGPGTRIGLAQLQLPAGSWRLETVPAGEVRITAGVSGTRRRIAMGPAPVTLEISPDTAARSIDVLLESPRPTTVKRLVATRAPAPPIGH